jgi:hypothetical protein
MVSEGFYKAKQVICLGRKVYDIISNQLVGIRS